MEEKDIDKFKRFFEGMGVSFRQFEVLNQTLLTVGEDMDFTFNDDGEYIGVRWAYLDDEGRRFGVWEGRGEE